MDKDIQIKRAYQIIAFLMLLITIGCIYLIISTFRNNEAKLRFLTTINKVDTLYMKEISQLYYKGNLVTVENWDEVDLNVCPIATVNKRGELHTTPLLYDGIEMKTEWRAYDTP